MRRKKHLKPNKTFFLFCEGETEICYFNELKGCFGYNIKKIEPIKTLSSSSTSKLENFKKNLYSKTGYSLDNFKDTQSKIFILIDLDIYSQEEIDLIKAILEDDNIKVTTSNHVFELWILLHFEKCKKESNDYIKRITKISGTKYQKGKGSCSIKFFRDIISTKLDEAINNAEELEKFIESQGKEKLKDKLPYTEVHKIINELKT